MSSLKPAKHKKTLNIWFIIPLIVFIGLIIILFQRLGKPTDVVTNTALERPVPKFELPLLSDTTRMVNDKNLPKQPFLLNIWGSWCITCKKEHPFLMELHKKGVTIVGVNYNDELADALNYLNQYGDPFLMSVQDESGGLVLDLGLTGAPETFVVDGQGFIRQHIIGDINEQNWQTRVEPCLNLLNKANQTGQLDTSEMSKVCQ